MPGQICLPGPVTGDWPCLGRAGGACMSFPTKAKPLELGAAMGR